MGCKNSACYKCHDSSLPPEEWLKLDGYHADPASWRASCIYYNGLDSRLFVPKRGDGSYGWTCNAYYFCPADFCGGGGGLRPLSAHEGLGGSGDHGLAGNGKQLPVGHEEERLLAPAEQAMKEA